MDFYHFQYKPFLEPRATGDVAFAQIGTKPSPPLPDALGDSTLDPSI
jgi:hypothetical protein